jgi:AraC family transcriptional regulator of adaptative response / DNA-3-methyladenine glycosylase II
MLPANGVLEQARKARDPRFDGRFFIGVRTTGIYCRPVCSVKMPRAENITFFDSAAAASEAGYRPCLRCRPEASPGTPAWAGTSTTVSRALRLINEGALDDAGVGDLSNRLGVTSRHLTRLFTKHLGASPITIAQTRRLQFAKKLIDETRLPMTEIAMSSGYGSIRRFNDHFSQTYKKSPSSLRSAKKHVNEDKIALKISYREPYDFGGLLDFYRLRAIPGVESVSNCYRRSFLLDGEPGCVSVTSDKSHQQLVCMVQGGSPKSLMKILSSVRSMFDVDAIPAEINGVLMQDRILTKRVRLHQGLRLPGAFDQFEVAVRAIVGQQISVKGATTVMGKIVEDYGVKTSFGLVFPGPEILADIDHLALPMPGKRALAIKELARRVAQGELRFDAPDEQDFVQQLVSIPGIGPWTAQYISLRARRNPDSFLHGDLVIKKVAAKLFGIEAEHELINRAENWRPWRGYAGMHLWRCAAELNGQE